MNRILSLLGKGLILYVLMAGVLMACGDDADNSVISPPPPTPESGS